MLWMDGIIFYLIDEVFFSGCMYFYFSIWISNFGYLFYGDIKRYKKKSKYFIFYFDFFSIMYFF